MSDYDLFVIGGGSGGVRAARIAAGHGARVGVAEERFWGGTCVNVGCVPKKFLVQAGEYGAWAEDSRGFGWDIVRGPHDWAKLIAAKDREIDRLTGIYKRLLEGAGADVFDARATFVDDHTLRVGERTVTADKIIIATGGNAVRPDIHGAELGILSDAAFYLPEMPKRVTMVGGGYIAVEFAGIFRALGAEVEMVYRQALPLRGFDAELREALAMQLESQGIRLHPSCSPRRVDADGDARVVTLANGHRIHTDLVFFATGRRPATDRLGLDEAGIATMPSGAIPVDGQLRTVRPHIYALGDVTDRMNLTPVATAEGHAVADALFGAGPQRRVDLENVATAVFSAPPLATVGLTEEAAALRGPADIFVTRFTPMRHALSGRDRRTLMKLIADHHTGRVLGCHMLGEDAAEIMQGVSVAMRCGATKADFDRTIGIHPTAAEEFVTLRTRTRTVGHEGAHATGGAHVSGYND